MAENTKLKVELDGSAEGLFAALDRASKQIHDFAKKGEKDIEGLNSPFEKLGGAFSAIKGAIAGLAVFEVMKASVEAAVELGSEVRRLSAYFQISSERAGELAEALKRMGSNPDEFIAMSDKVAKTLKKNTDAFDKYGIETKKIGADGKEHWLSQVEIMESVGTALNGIEGSTARNIAAQELLGKGGKEAAEYLRKLAAAAVASKKNLEEMGIAIDYKKLADDTKEYKKSQADISQAFEVMKVVAGQELLPSLIDLSRFFSSILGPVVQGVSWGIKAITTAFWTLKYVIEMGVADITDFALKASTVISGVIDIASALMKGDLSGAKAAFKATNAEYIRVHKETKAIMADVEEDYGKKLVRTWGDGLEKKKALHEEEADGGKRTVVDDREKDQKIIDAIKAQLEEKRKARALELGIDEAFFQLSAKETLAFWKQQELVARESEKANSFVRQEVKQSKIANLKEDDDLLKANLAKNLASQKGDYAAQLKLADQFLADIAVHHTKDSKEYIDALKKREEIRNTANEAQKKYDEEVIAGQKEHSLALLNLDIEYINIAKSNREITEESALRQIITINASKYQAEKKALEDRLNLAKLEPAERQKIQNQLKALEDRNAKDTLKTANDLYLQMRKKSPMAGINDGAKDYVDKAKDHFTNFKNYTVNILNAAQTGIQNALKGMLTGQMSFGEAMKGIWSGIASAVLDAVTSMIAQWLVAQAAQMIFGTTSKATQNLEAAAYLDTATAEAWAAYGWMPFIGPALAQAQIVAMMASYTAAKAANKGITALATGGLIDKPTVSLMGEAGPELVAPKQDFMQVTKSLVASGASMYQAIVESQAKTKGYAASGNKYAPKKGQVLQSAQTGHTFNITTALGDKRELAKTIKTLLNNDTRIFGTA